MRFERSGLFWLAQFIFKFGLTLQRRVLEWQYQLFVYAFLCFKVYAYPTETDYRSHYLTGIVLGIFVP